MHVSGSDDGPVTVIDENAAPAAPLRLHHILAVVPTVGLLGGIPFANRVEPYVLGLPFLLFWVVMWVVTTSAVMAIIATIDSRIEDAEATREAKASRGTTGRPTA